MERNCFLRPPRRKHKIEFIGDSITAGFKVHGVYNAANCDGRLTYGYLAAEAVNAEPWLTAVSGIGVAHNYQKVSDDGVMPKRYPYIIGGNEDLKVDFKAWDPEIITINLGTNDTSLPCSEEAFSGHYLSFLRDLRRYHPNSWILVLNPFHGYWESNLKSIVDQRKKEGDTRIAWIDTKGWLNVQTGCTDGTHPNPQGHQAVAEKLVPVLKEYLEKK